MQKLLEESINDIDEITYMFLADEKEAYVNLPHTLTKVNEILNTFINLFASNGDEVSSQWVSNVSGILLEYGTQIEKRDTIGIMDTMEYKIKPILQELYSIM